MQNFAGSALTDVQTISIGSTVVQEKQVITFEEWETQEPSPSEWAITVSCLQDSCDGYSFKITIFGVNTGRFIPTFKISPKQMYFSRFPISLQILSLFEISDISTLRTGNIVQKNVQKTWDSGSQLL